MNKGSDHANSPADIQRLVGSLILQFQQLELQLKFLLSRGSFRGTLHELELIFQRMPGETDNRTLGQLVKALGESHVGPGKTEPDPTPVGLEIVFSFHFTIGGTEEFRSRFQSRLTELITARNMLVHQSLLSFDLATSEGRANACRILEDQSRKLVAMRQDMDALIQTLKASVAEGLSVVAKDLNQRGG